MSNRNLLILAPEEPMDEGEGRSSSLYPRLPSLASDWSDAFTLLCYDVVWSVTQCIV